MLKSELEFTKREENKQKAIVLYLIEEKKNWKNHARLKFKLCWREAELPEG